jgi:hypothetical protein
MISIDKRGGQAMKYKFLIATAAVALLTGPMAASAQVKPRETPAASDRAPTKPDNRQPAAQDRKSGRMTPGSNAQRPDGDRPGMRGKQVQDGTRERGSGPRRGDAKPPGDSPNKAVEGRDGRPDRDRSPDGDRNRAAEGSRGPENLSPQQRTKIRQSFRQHRNAPRENSVSFNISIGTTIPSRIQLAPIPVQVIEYYPRWRGYRYFLVGDEIVIVHPQTLEIVAVLPA